MSRNIALNIYCRTTEEGSKCNIWDMAIYISLERDWNSLSFTTHKSSRKSTNNKLLVILRFSILEIRVKYYGKSSSIITKNQKAVNIMLVLCAPFGNRVNQKAANLLAAFFLTVNYNMKSSLSHKYNVNFYNRKGSKLTLTDYKLNRK